jgi:acetoacetate decarboxylase
MLQGFSTPLSPTGASALAPTPPWHYVSDFLTVEFWAHSASVADVLPRGMAPPDGSHTCCYLHFTDNQYTSDALSEHREPAMSQYQECFVTVEAQWGGERVGFVPYIFVDNDNSMMRGLLQGMPKQMASVRMTRAFGLPSPASPRCGEPGEYFATLSHRDRRLATASVRVTQSGATLPTPRTVLNYRHFAALEHERRTRPLVHELVRQKRRDIVLSEIWAGPATLALEDSPWHELGALRPVRVGRGFRYTRAMTVDDLEPVAPL